MLGERATGKGLRAAFVQGGGLRVVQVTVDLEKALDKAYEGRALEEILDAPVSALAGVSEADARHLEAAFGIRTVRDLGRNRYFAIAGVLVALSGHAGGRADSVADEPASDRSLLSGGSDGLGVEEISLSIYATANASSPEWQALELAVLLLAGRLGYVPDRLLPRVLGSVWDRAFWRRAVSSEEAKRLAAKVEQLAELHLVDRDQAAVTGDLAEAFERVAKAMEQMPSACVVIGNLAFIKTSRSDGQGGVLARTLSARELRLLSEYPEIMTRADRFLAALSTAVAADDSSRHLGT